MVREDGCMVWNNPTLEVGYAVERPVARCATRERPICPDGGLIVSSIECILVYNQCITTGVRRGYSFESITVYAGCFFAIWPQINI